MLTPQSSTPTYRIMTPPAWLPESFRKGFEYVTGFSKSERRVLRRRKAIKPSEWCQKHRFITYGPMAGSLMKFEITPHVRGQIDAIFTPSVRRATICAAAQTAKSTLADSAHLYRADRKPGPAISIYPDQQTGEKNFKRRLTKAVDLSPRLRSLKTGNRDDITSKLIKLQTMFIDLGWAGSAISLSNESYQFVDLQEVDKYNESPNKRESGTMELAFTRVVAFPNDHLILITSTPTIEAGQVWQSLLESQVIFEYYVHCPVCFEEQLMSFENIKWGKDENGHSLPWKEIEEKELAWYECANENCRHEWTDHLRNKAIQHGVWRAKRDDERQGLELFHYLRLYRPKSIGFHQPSWISYFVPFYRVAADFLKCKDQSRTRQDRKKSLKDFYNKHRAEPWQEYEQEKQEAEILKLRDDRPAGVVPGHNKVAGLFAYVDVQLDSFYYTIVGYGYGLTGDAWLIRYGHIASFKAVEEVLWKNAYRDPDGNMYQVQLALMDSAYRTSEVYQFCLEHLGLIMPTKGEQTMAQPFTYVDVEYYPGSKKRFPGGLKRVRVNTTYYKDQIDSRLRTLPADPGTIHLHSETDEAFAAQILAEAKDDVTGFWSQIGNRANHYLDCLSNVQVAADIRGVRYWPNPEEQAAEEDDFIIETDF